MFSWGADPRKQHEGVERPMIEATVHLARRHDPRRRTGLIASYPTVVPALAVGVLVAGACDHAARRRLSRRIGRLEAAAEDSYARGYLDGVQDRVRHEH